MTAGHRRRPPKAAADRPSYSYSNTVMRPVDNGDNGDNFEARGPQRFGEGENAG